MSSGFDDKPWKQMEIHGNSRFIQFYSKLIQHPTMFLDVYCRYLI